MAKICVIFNPTARGDKAQHFRAQLQAFSDRVTLRPTDAPGAARRIAQAAAIEGFDRVVAAGGDGTVNEVANGLLDAESSGCQAALGIIPLGTVNVFAKELRIPSPVHEALRIVEQGHLRSIDAPMAKFLTAGGIKESRAFMQLAGAGLDARAIAKVRWSLKKKLGPLAYVIAGIEALREPIAPIQITSAERRATGALVLIGNGRYYGGRFVVFPDADLSDGWLDVAVFPRANVWTLMCFGMGWMTGNVHRWTNVILWRTQKLTLSCSDPMPFELEGDNVGSLPVEVGITGRTLKVITPS